MGIFKKALHSKIDVFIKFESAINLEITITKIHIVNILYSHSQGKLH